MTIAIAVDAIESFIKATPHILHGMDCWTQWSQQTTTLVSINSYFRHVSKPYEYNSRASEALKGVNKFKLLRYVCVCIWMYVEH